jgi:hypothetical protein
MTFPSGDNFKRGDGWLLPIALLGAALIVIGLAFLSGGSTSSP